MRRSAGWMTVWDDRILELLADQGPTPVRQIEEHEFIRVSKATVSRRCRKLASKGLLEEFGNGVYGPTNKGFLYLDEQYDADQDQIVEEEPSESNRSDAVRTTETDTIQTPAGHSDPSDWMIGPGNEDTDTKNEK